MELLGGIPNRSIMKTTYGLFLFLAFTGVVNAQNKLVVHEWGTFTTLTSSDGQQYEAPLRSLEELPSFVLSQTYQYTDYDPKDGRLLQGNAIMYGANMGMETPVLYFYSEKALDFQFNVTFKNGTISQFFPRPTQTEDFISPAKSIQLQGHTGYATWKGHIWEKSKPVSPTFSDQQANAIWNHPRAVASNIVEVSGQREKYLFYRGLGYYACPIRVENDLDRVVKITNTSNEFLPFYVCTEMVDGELLIHSFGSLESNHCVSFTRDQKLEINVREKMIEALVAEGLYEDEAKAMIATWNESYFESSGLKVFWIVPQSIINDLLPITMNPQPTELKRAFFGRIEVMEAEFEAYLRSYESNRSELYDLVNTLRTVDPYRAQRIGLYWAYAPSSSTIANRIDLCAQNVGLPEENTPDFAAYPNPAHSHVFVQANFDLASLNEIRILDQLGKPVLIKTLSEVNRNEHIMLIDVRDIPSGMYFIQVQIGDAVLTKKLLIQAQ